MNIRETVRIAAVALVLSCAEWALAASSTVYGATYYMNANATDFGVAGGYTLDESGDTPATSTPGATDEVIVPAGTFAITVPSDSFTTLSGVARVRPSDGAVLEFTADEGVTGTFNAPVNWDGEVAAYNDDGSIHYYGKLVKKGAGTLVLASSGRTQGTTGLNQDYTTGIDLQEGTLKLPQHAVGYMYFGDLTMSNGTKLVTCGNITNMNLATFTYLRSLNGDGIITNETTRSKGQVCTPYAREEKIDNVFHGTFCDPAKYWLSGRLVQYGTNTGVTTEIVIEANKGHLNDGYDCGTFSFEDVGVLGPSSCVRFYGNGAGLHYFGADDAEISKDMYLLVTGYPAFIDAGWHGGLTVSGAWNVMGTSTANAVSKWIVLMGSNTVPCTITGEFSDNNWADTDWATGSPRTIFTQKLGSGTWRLAGSRSHGGGFAIEEGTLQFESIAEKGETSSLGLSTNLTTACSVRDVSEYVVDYAFSLGSTNSSAPAAVFEFVGTNSSVSLSRPLVLAGEGGSMRASGADGSRIGFGGVSALGSGETTLTLDGTNTGYNVVTGISDGNGTVSVVKDGDGVWYLSGTNTFSGDLSINAGTLVLLGSRYTWFRLVVKEVGNGGNALSMRQLALYDADGIRQNICLKANSPTGSSPYYPDSDWEGLEPGYFAFGSDAFRYSRNDGGDVGEIFSDIGNTASGGTPRFDGETSYGKRFYMKAYALNGSTALSIQKANSGSWIPFVMRLTNGAPEIVSYDIESYYHSGATNQWPKIATMEASVDGVAWTPVETNAQGEVLAEHDYDFSIPLGSDDPGANAGNANRWYSDGTAQVNWSSTTGTTPRPGAGFPIIGKADLPMPLQNVRSVSVAAGATLRAETDVYIASLKVAADGAGTLEGFTFASDGTLDVEFDGDLPRSAVLPGSYVDCSGIENVAGWSLKVNGSLSNKYRIRASGGVIRLTPRGAVILIR